MSCSGAQADFLGDGLGERLDVLAPHLAGVLQAVTDDGFLVVRAEQFQRDAERRGAGDFFQADEVLDEFQGNGVMFGEGRGAEGEDEAHGLGRAAGLAEVVDDGRAVIEADDEGEQGPPPV